MPPRYAVNIADLARLEEIPRLCLMAPVVQSRTTIRAEPGMIDGAAIVLECPERQAAAICDLVRDLDVRAKRYETRCYIEGKRGGWHRMKRRERILKR